MGDIGRYQKVSGFAIIVVVVDPRDFLLIDWIRGKI